MTDYGPPIELPWIWSGIIAYLLAFLFSFYGTVRTAAQSRVDTAHVTGNTNITLRHERLVLMLIIIGVVLLTIAMAQRWDRIGHGPFIHIFELLISQLFSLGLLYGLVYWRLPTIRPSAVIVMPLLLVLGFWAVFIGPVDIPLPPTYYNDWLWAHVGFGKVFLSFCLIGTGLAGIILLRATPAGQRLFHLMPDDQLLDNLAWRFMLVAFVFESLMLIAGAVWAQDAWGRYWSWDALETSSFLNWLMLGIAIHARLAYKIPRRVMAWAIVAVFLFAFYTYFGTPFVTEAIHKGVI